MPKPTKIVGQQKQCPEEGIPEEGPTPKHLNTTRIDSPEYEQALVSL